MHLSLEAVIQSLYLTRHSRESGNPSRMRFLPFDGYSAYAEYDERLENLVRPTGVEPVFTT